MDLPEIQVEVIILDSVQNIPCTLTENTFCVGIHSDHKAKGDFSGPQSPHKTTQGGEYVCTRLSKQLLEFINKNCHTCVAVSKNDVGECLQEKNDVCSRGV